jgi:hypothetical protein
MNSAAAPATDSFPAILRESVIDVMDAHRRAELREVSPLGFTQYVWVCKCGAEANRPMSRPSASRGHGLHRGAAERRLDKAQNAALAEASRAERLSYADWAHAQITARNAQ